MGDRAALAVLLAARRSAVDARTTAQRQIHALVVAAPESHYGRGSGARRDDQVVTIGCPVAHRVPLRTLETKTTDRCAATPCSSGSSSSRPRPRHTSATSPTIVRAWRPELLEECGVGPVVAATVLCAWSHPGRFRSDGAFAEPCWCVADSGLVGPDRPSPPEPPRRPPAQPGAPRRRHQQDPPRRCDPGLRRAQTS